MALVSTVEWTTAMGHIAGENHHAEMPFPQRLDDYITDDNPVRFIDAFVDALDLGTQGFRHAVAAATGHPAQALHLRLSVPLTIEPAPGAGNPAPRRTDVVVQKATARSQTSANVRREHLAPLREVCRALRLLCTQLDLFGGELVAIDGSQFRAVNAKGRTFTTAKLA